MSDVRTALGAARYEGFVTVAAAGPQGMITVRGDLAAIGAAVAGVAGVPLPGRREARIDGDRGFLWMSPDEVMVLVPHAEAGATVAALQAALGGAHALVVDVSDARAVITLQGAGVREVLAKVSPADFAPDAFAAPMFRRTRLAQVPVAVWMTGEDAFSVICFRSVAQYVFDVLKTGAAPGSEVGVYS